VGDFELFEQAGLLCELCDDLSFGGLFLLFSPVSLSVCTIAVSFVRHVQFCIFLSRFSTALLSDDFFFDRDGTPFAGFLESSFFFGWPARVVLFFFFFSNCCPVV